MRCNNCGAEISDNALFCRVCGVRISESKTLTNDEKTSETAEATYAPKAEAVPNDNESSVDNETAYYPDLEAVSKYDETPPDTEAAYAPKAEAVSKYDETPPDAEAEYYPESEIIPSRNGQNREIDESCPDEPKDYVNRSVLMTLVFGMIFGLIALFYALTARSCFEDGEEENGIKKAKTALRLCRISLVFGIIKWLAIFSAGFLLIYII